MILGITGKTGVGKTTVTSFIKKHYGGEIFSLDVIAKTLYKKNSIQNQIKEQLGKTVFSTNGKIDLRELRKRVFTDSRELEKLDQIMFKAIYRETKKQLNKTKNPLKIIEGFALFQTKLDKLTDKNIFVKSSEAQQKIRQKTENKFSDQEIIFLLSQQKSIDKFTNQVDFTVENNDSLTQLKKKITKIIKKLQKDT